ncbi:MAG: CARDB domain-containing protein [Archaeoglobaceae archaeon]
MRTLALILLLLVQPSIAVSVSYTLNPEILLPGDYADCVLTISTNQEVKVNSITITGYGVQVEPSILAGGNVSGSYTVPFSIKAERAGRYNVEVVISYDGGTIVQNVLVVVDDNFPSITPLEAVYEGEVNRVRFAISTPVELRDVRVKPLFNSSPPEVFLGTVDGKAEFELQFEAAEKLDFELSFYNGRNYHLLRKSVEVTLLPSKGVAIVANLSSPTAYVGETVKVDVTISNLRGDSVYDVVVSLVGNGSVDASERKIPELDSGSSKVLSFLYSPKKPGVDDLEIVARYKDEFGNEHELREEVRLKVLDGYQLVFTGVELSGFGIVRVSGDVSNVGKSTAYNVYVEARCGESVGEFVGNVEPSDFQGFEVELPCNDSVELVARWNNELGEVYEVSKVLERKVEEVEVAPSPVYPAIAAAVVVLLIVVAVIVRYLRR